MNQSGNRAKKSGKRVHFFSISDMDDNTGNQMGANRNQQSMEDPSVKKQMMFDYSDIITMTNTDKSNKRPQPPKYEESQLPILFKPPSNQTLGMVKQPQMPKSVTGEGLFSQLLKDKIEEDKNKKAQTEIGEYISKMGWRPKVLGVKQPIAKPTQNLITQFKQVLDEHIKNNRSNGEKDNKVLGGQENKKMTKQQPSMNMFVRQKLPNILKNEEMSKGQQKKIGEKNEGQTQHTIGNKNNNKDGINQSIEPSVIRQGEEYRYKHEYEYKTGHGYEYKPQEITQQQPQQQQQQQYYQPYPLQHQMQQQYQSQMQQYPQQQYQQYQPQIQQQYQYQAQIPQYPQYPQYQSQQAQQQYGYNNDVGVVEYVWDGSKYVRKQAIILWHACIHLAQQQLAITSQQQEIDNAFKHSHTQHIDAQQINRQQINRQQQQIQQYVQQQMGIVQDMIQQVYRQYRYVREQQQQVKAQSQQIDSDVVLSMVIADRYRQLTDMLMAQLRQQQHAILLLHHHNNLLLASIQQLQLQLQHNRQLNRQHNRQQDRHRWVYDRIQQVQQIIYSYAHNHITSIQPQPQDNIGVDVDVEDIHTQLYYIHHILAQAQHLTQALNHHIHLYQHIL